MCQGHTHAVTQARGGPRGHARGKVARRSREEERERMLGGSASISARAVGLSLSLGLAVCFFPACKLLRARWARPSDAASGPVQDLGRWATHDWCVKWDQRRSQRDPAAGREKLAAGRELGPPFLLQAGRERKRGGIPPCTLRAPVGCSFFRPRRKLKTRSTSNIVFDAGRKEVGGRPGWRKKKNFFLGRPTLARAGCPHLPPITAQISLCRAADTQTKHTQRSV